MPFNEELFALSMDHATSPELPALKRRFEGFDICKDKATAAAFGYLAAMRDAENKNKAEEPSIYDRIAATIDQAVLKINGAEETVDLVMGLVWQWLRQKLEEEDYDWEIIDEIGEMFRPYPRPNSL